MLLPDRLVAKIVGTLALCLLLIPTVQPAPASAQHATPNIVLILVDDMGYSDLGCFGSQIRTPHLDQLAREGLRFTQFYNCAKCETTRATLLSGRYHTEVGIQKLANCLTLAEALKLGGYQTFMTGKWHLDGNPIDRGFDRYFGHLSGVTNFFRGDETFRLDRDKFQVPDEGFYTTDANVDYAMRFVEGRDKSRPFFLYVAFNAPHYPLQAPREEVEKYLDRFSIGWDEMRASRLRRMKELGIVDDALELSPRPADVPAWDSLTLEQRREQILLMATYAGMIDRVDQNIGRLLSTLKAEGIAENTLLLFLSDNGACPFQRTKAATRENNWEPWDPRSFWTYDKGWAHACNTPWREYKQNQHEGGISTCLIAHWPLGIANPGEINPTVGHLVDIMPTCLELADVTYPEKVDDRDIGPLRGTSLASVLQGKAAHARPDLFFTFYGKNNALRQGDWKIVSKDFGPWELYNIAQDRTEQIDLSRQQPQKLDALVKLWQAEALRQGVTKRRRNE